MLSATAREATPAMHPMSTANVAKPRPSYGWITIVREALTTRVPQTGRIRARNCSQARFAARLPKAPDAGNHKADTPEDCIAKQGRDAPEQSAPYPSA